MSVLKTHQKQSVKSKKMVAVGKPDRCKQMISPLDCQAKPKFWAVT
jgi:hypothetical protein